MQLHSVKLERVLRGLHHVTAFAGDAQSNLDFYTEFLGLRLIKRTVNFDDPATYHFYFGPSAQPGVIATFFPWPTAPAGRTGSGQVPALAFAVPKNALGYWIERARPAKVDCSAPETRFGDALITLRDRAGLPVELIERKTTSARNGIVRLHSATLSVADPEPTARFLTDLLDFQYAASEHDRARFVLDGALVDVIAAPDADRAKLSSGMVHHVAWRVADEAEQSHWREKLKAAGVRVTRVIDRKYFRSIYFREPGGVLFEIATEGPGFTVDEPAERLGCALQLPPWLEPIRESIERRLPKVNLECAGSV
jgi:glyoxalase family protein